MSLSRLLTVAACAASLFQLAACSSNGPVEAVNPTIAEMDRLDVQWGLPPRRSRGAPRRTYRYQAPSGGVTRSPASAPAAPAPAPREVVNEPPPAGLVPEPAPSPAAINSLR